MARFILLVHLAVLILHVVESYPLPRHRVHCTVWTVHLAFLQLLHLFRTISIFPWIEQRP